MNKRKCNLIGLSGKLQSGKDLIGNIIRYLIQQKRIGENHSRENWINWTYQDDLQYDSIEDASEAYEQKRLELFNIETPKFNNNNTKKNFIITDVRYLNEAQAIKDRGGIIIRVNRPCKKCSGLGYHKMDCGVGRIEHYSETALDKYNKFDYTIENDSDIPSLIEKVRKILTELKLI